MLESSVCELDPGSHSGLNRGCLPGVRLPRQHCSCRAALVSGANTRVPLPSKGVGRGGLKEKKFTAPSNGKLDDEVTPLGLFTVDVVMSEDGSHDGVSDVIKERYKDDARYGEFITHEGGLNRLFKNMNKLDFNRDAYADEAYGKGYWGLNVAGEEAADAKKIRLSWQGLCYSSWCWVRTGPKMTIHFVDGTEQVGWHSVAIHGTNRRDKIGRASSGGAVYISSDVISRIFESGHLKLGSLVKIADEPPTEGYAPHAPPPSAPPPTQCVEVCHKDKCKGTRTNSIPFNHFKLPFGEVRAPKE